MADIVSVEARINNEGPYLRVYLFDWNQGKMRKVDLRDVESVKMSLWYLRSNGLLPMAGMVYEMELQGGAIMNYVEEKLRELGMSSLLDKGDEVKKNGEGKESNTEL